MTLFQMTATPNHVPQRTAPHITARASAIPLPPTMLVAAPCAALAELWVVRYYCLTSL
jgi:hypothetical protein